LPKEESNREDDNLEYCTRYKFTRENSPSFQLSEKDQHILELNQQGFSSTKISGLLRSRYGIELCPRAVRRHLTELRQDKQNNVRVNRQPPKRSKENDKWYNIILELRNYIAGYTQRNGFKPSVRTAFYDMQDDHNERLEKGLLPDKRVLKHHDYATFIQRTVIARLGWKDANGELIFPKLDIDCFADDKSRLTINRYDDHPPKQMIEPGDEDEIPDPDEYIQDFIDNLKRAPEWYDGAAPEGEDGKRGGRWYGQPEYCELWEEKNDLLEGFDKLLEDRCIKIRAIHGFSSTSFLDQCCSELKELIESKGLRQEHIWIKYAGDWDPAGAYMEYYIKKRLKQLGLGGVHVERVAVTLAQIGKYNLPLMPIEPQPGKQPDPNMKEFKRRYGNKATHLNAFFTEKHIDDFKKILLASVDKHWDPEIYDKMVERYEIKAPEPPRYTDEELEDIRRDMYEQITEAFKPGWENENDDDDDEDNE
jgi:hypothetical protein